MCFGNVFAAGGADLEFARVFGAAFADDLVVRQRQAAALQVFLQLGLGVFERGGGLRQGDEFRGD